MTTLIIIALVLMYLTIGAGIHGILESEGYGSLQDNGQQFFVVVIFLWPIVLILIALAKVSDFIYKKLLK